MDKDLKQGPETQDCQAEKAPAAETGASRRRFARNAVLGSAVIFSLGNRAAWGTVHADDTCVSDSVLASFAANDLRVASARPGRTQEMAKAQEILRPSNDDTRHTHGNQTCIKNN